MDVPCPKCNSADLQKVFLAREEVYRCCKPAPFRGVLVGSSGSELLARTSITTGTRQTVLIAQSGGVVTCQIFSNTPARLFSIETFVDHIPVATVAFGSLLAARRENRVAGRTLRAES